MIIEPWAYALGGEGSEEGSSPPDIMWFFGQNAHDWGNDIWVKTLQNNAVGMISKLVSKVSNQLLSLELFLLKPFRFY